MHRPSYEFYERLRKEGNTNAEAAELLGVLPSFLEKIGLAKRYREAHPEDVNVVRELRPIGVYLNKNNDYYKNERAPRKEMMDRANVLRRKLFERYGDYALYPSDDPDWIELRKLNKKMK